MIFVNDLSPVLFSAGPVVARWYGLLFALGIAFNYLFLTWIFRKRGHPVADLDSLAMYLFLGLLIGARLGHIFFYNWEYFSSNPGEILKVWNGGLASHGAAIGLFLAYFIWGWVHKVKFSKYADLLVLPIPITGAFVRIGNFFNSEIVGIPTGSGTSAADGLSGQAGQADGSWGVVFKRLGEDFPRHPVQLYEAGMGVLIFIVLFWAYKKYYGKVRPLFFLFLYLLLYFSGRFGAEFFKEQHGITPDGFLAEIGLSTGQVLSIVPVLVAVGWFAIYCRKAGAR